MKNKLYLLAITMLALATPVFAQGSDAAAGSGEATRKAAAYLAMGIAAGLCGIGQGRATASAAEAMARNPSAVAAIRVGLFVGLALIESLALYTFVITYVVK